MEKVHSMNSSINMEMSVDKSDAKPKEMKKSSDPKKHSKLITEVEDFTKLLSEREHSSSLNVDNENQTNKEIKTYSTKRKLKRKHTEGIEEGSSENMKEKSSFDSKDTEQLLVESSLLNITEEQITKTKRRPKSKHEETLANIDKKSNQNSKASNTVSNDTDQLLSNIKMKLVQLEEQAGEPKDGTDKSNDQEKLLVEGIIMWSK